MAPLSPLDDILARLEAHAFAPIHNGFTVDPEADADGVPDRRSTDWRVHTLAARDLVRLGRDDIAPVADMLEHDGLHVRQLGAMALGLRYGIDPWQFAVHSEMVNRPTTVIIDPEGAVRLAYTGRYWGDRPTIGQILDMIETDTCDFEAPPLRRGPH